MRVVCFGDSLTSCGGPGGRYSDILQDRFPGHEIINRGVGGETFIDARARLAADVLALRPDAVVIAFGANDWWRDERPPEAWAADLAAVVEAVQSQGARAIVAGVFGPLCRPDGTIVEKTYGADARSRHYRDLEAAVAAAHGCPYVPNLQRCIVGDRTCWRDRNHPNEHGNRAVANELEPHLEAILGQKALPVRRRAMLTTRDMWDEAVALAGDRLAAVCGQRRLTYAAADEAVRALAAGLRERTGQDRPKVAVFLPNSLEYFLVYWAVVRLGGIIVPLNTWLRPDSLEAIFETVAPDLLVVGSTADEAVLACARRRPDLPVVATADTGGALPAFASLLKHGAALTATPLAGDDPSIIMHTSGTTAAPKGAVMRHSDLVFNVMTTINAQGFTPDDVHLLVNPMFHCTALYSSLPAAALQKTPVVITADTTPNGLLRLIAEEGITTFLTVPSILQRITALPDLTPGAIGSLRVIGYAGSFMPVKTVRELQRLFPGVELHNFFGLTETISATHCLNGDESYERPDSIGRLLPFVEALVVDEDHRPVPPGTVGELLFARDNVIQGYWNRPGKLEESLLEVDGRRWFNTGDLAMVDEEGFFFIKGRKKDMIIVGGENVFAAEVEAALMACEKVKEAAVKGIPATGIRESLGEMIKAYVVRADPTLTEIELRRHCHKALPSYKIPHVIEFLAALPRNPAGKVVKDDLA
ncbi:MAG: AMP-binding protein [Lentisphaerae bacterium]|nr:AMP-binding protein [Lentisphaerota bacterium]